MGSGATWPGTTTCGRWLPIEAREHINFQELKTAHLALQAFFRTYAPTPKHVLLLMDNSKAVEYLNKREGTKSYSLSAEALELWAMVLEAGCWITANSIADQASREFNNYS